MYACMHAGVCVCVSLCEEMWGDRAWWQFKQPKESVTEKKNNSNDNDEKDKEEEEEALHT